ncbi:MAG TPA: XdhC family protein [Acidisarcina sp.]
MERRKLIELWRSALLAGEEFATATVVRVEGSSYRRPGATLLLTRGGRRAGMVSGGCLEGEVSRRIWWLTEAGSAVEAYTTSFDDDGEAGYGMGCGGKIFLLLERGAAAGQRLEAMRRSVEERSAAAVVTVIEAGSVRPGAQGIGVRIGDRMVVHGAGERGLAAGSGDGVAAAGGVPDQGEMGLGRRSSPLERRMVEAGASASRERSPAMLHLEAEDQAVTVLAEYLAPPPRLFVFGAGDDAQPVAELAAGLGWEVVVADGRSNLATRERFPSAHRLVVLHGHRPHGSGVRGSQAAGQETGSLETGSSETGSSGGSLGSLADLRVDGVAVGLGIGAGDCAAILTHSFEQDRAILSAILPLGLRYVGVLGPRRRTVQLVAEVTGAPGGVAADAAADRGRWADALQGLHSPAGLDLGADGPETIALSIIAEVQATLEGRSAVPLGMLCSASLPDEGNFGGSSSVQGYLREREGSVWRGETATDEIAVLQVVGAEAAGGGIAGEQTSDVETSTAETSTVETSSVEVGIERGR